MLGAVEQGIVTNATMKCLKELEAQALINYLIKEVVLYDDKIEIYFNKPTRTSPDGDRGFSVYSEKTEKHLPSLPI